MKKTILLILALAVAFPAAANRPLPESEQFARLDEYIRKVREEWQINSLVVQIGDDREVLFSKGYGNRDDGADTLVGVDAHTAFQVASVTKSFTAAVIASMVDEGLVKWDDRVVDIIPEFRLFDDWRTADARIKDFTCHRAGFKGQDGTSLSNLGYDKEDLMHMIRYFQPAYGFRDGYQYNNVAFCVPAVIAERVTRKSWQENVRERLFEPIGMTESTFKGPGYRKCFDEGTASWPYDFVVKNGSPAAERLTPEMVERAWTATCAEAAGGVVCTPADMLKWAQFHLNGGKAGDRQVISRKQMDFMHTGVNVMEQSPDRIVLYGQAWIVEQSSKGRIIYHTGTNAGQVSLCVLLPDINRVFTFNANTKVGNEPRFAILRRYIDLALGYEDYDYSAESLTAWKKKNAGKVTMNNIADRTLPKSLAKKYEGRYVCDDVMGDIRISIRRDRLYMKMVKTGREFELIYVSGTKFKAKDFKYEVEFGKKGALTFTSGLPKGFPQWKKK